MSIKASLPQDFAAGYDIIARGSLAGYAFPEAYRKGCY
jgi:hypothetical protein